MALKNIKVNQVIYNGVDTLRMVDADIPSDYDIFVETSDADAVVTDITKDKSVIVNGTKIVGTYEKPNGSITYTTNGTFDVEHKAEAVVNVEGGKTPVYQEKQVTPSTNEQVVEPDNGFDALTKVIINGDENLMANNIKKDIEIFGITGDYEGAGKTGSFIYTLDYYPEGAHTNAIPYGFVGAYFTGIYSNIHNDGYVVLLGDDCTTIGDLKTNDTYGNCKGLFSTNNFENIVAINSMLSRNNVFLGFQPKLLFPNVTAVGDNTFWDAFYNHKNIDIQLPKATAWGNKCFQKQFAGTQSCSGNVLIGSIGYPVSTSVPTNAFLNDNSTEMTITVFAKPSEADTMVTNIRTAGCTGWTIVIKAAEDGIYDESAVSAGDTIITSAGGD